jgi:hypothetical protein
VPMRCKREGRRRSRIIQEIYILVLGSSIVLVLLLRYRLCIYASMTSVCLLPIMNEEVSWPVGRNSTTIISLY